MVVGGGHRARPTPACPPREALGCPCSGAEGACLPVGGSPASAACGPRAAPSGFGRRHPVGLRGSCCGVRAGPLPCSSVTASEALWEGAAPDHPQVAQPGRLESSRAVPVQGPPAPSMSPTAGARAAPRVSVLGLDRRPGGLLSVREGCRGAGQGRLLGGAACPLAPPHSRARAWLQSWALSALESHCSRLPRQEISTPLPGSAGWKAAVHSGLIQPGLARCAHGRRSERHIGCLALTDSLHRLSLGGVFVRGRYGRPRSPGPARRIRPASRVIKPFVRPVCGGWPACRLRLGAGCTPTHVAPWVHTGPPRGL